MNSKITVKKIKKYLKQNSQLQIYKKSFSVKKLQFVLSKVSILFSSSLPIDQIAALEINLSQNINSEENWKKIWTKLGNSFSDDFKKANWNSFALFMFFVYNHWMYWNKKHKNESIYNLENYNNLNNIKTREYGVWIDSMIATNNKEFNSYIRKVLNLI